MSLHIENPTTLTEAREIAARLIAERQQFAFSARDGLMTISYPDGNRLAKEGDNASPTVKPRDPNPPRSAA